jgi:hypothetical protein
MSSLPLRESTDQTFPPYTDDPDRPSAEQDRLLGVEDAEYEVYSDNDFDAQENVSRKPSLWRQLLFRAGAAVKRVGGVVRRESGRKRRIARVHIFGILSLIVALLILITIVKVWHLRTYAEGRFVVDASHMSNGRERTNELFFRVWNRLPFNMKLSRERIRNMSVFKRGWT